MRSSSLSYAEANEEESSEGSLRDGGTVKQVTSYRRPCPGTQPDLLHRPYVSSIKRAPTKPLVLVPHTISEVTGPILGGYIVKPGLCDLTRQKSGIALGERIIVSGMVKDESGRALADTLIELWQANAAGRYLHDIDQHDAPLDPNFTGCGRIVRMQKAATASLPSGQASTRGGTTTTHGARPTFISRCSVRHSPRGW